MHNWLQLVPFNFGSLLKLSFLVIYAIIKYTFHLSLASSSKSELWIATSSVKRKPMSKEKTLSRT